MLKQWCNVAAERKCGSINMVTPSFPRCILLFASIVRNYHGTQKAMLNFCYPKLLLCPPLHSRPRRKWNNDKKICKSTSQTLISAISALRVVLGPRLVFRSTRRMSNLHLFAPRPLPPPWGKPNKVLGDALKWILSHPDTKQNKFAFVCEVEP